MVIISALPPGLLQHNFERYRPENLWGSILVRFISNKVETTDKNDGRQSVVKIVISFSVTKSLKFYHDGNTETAIELIKVHKEILYDNKLSTLAQANRALSNRKQAQSTQLQTDAVDNHAKIEFLEEANRELRAVNAHLQEDLFDYF